MCYLPFQRESQVEMLSRMVLEVFFPVNCYRNETSRQMKVTMLLQMMFNDGFADFECAASVVSCGKS